MGIEFAAVVLLPFWIGAASLAGRAAGAAGRDEKRWFRISALLGPVGWIGAYVIARDARERVAPRRDPRSSLRSKRSGNESPSPSKLVRLARSAVPFLESKNHGGV